MLHELIQVIRALYAKNYPAHTLQHAHNVAQLAAVYANRFASQVLAEAVVAGYLHDICAGLDRENHHTLAAHTLQGGDLSEWFTGYCSRWDLDGALIIAGCAEHRASYKGEFTSPVSECVSCADRGYPCADLIIERVIAFEPERALTQGIEFLQTKWGSKGYASFHGMYMELFGELRQKMASFIDDTPRLEARMIELGARR